MSAPVILPGLAATALVCWGAYLGLKVLRMPAVRPGVADSKEAFVPGTYQLDTASLFWVKWNIYGALVGFWFLTIEGMISRNPRVVPIYVLLPISALMLWWLSGFRHATLSGRSLIVRDSTTESHVPLEAVKRVVEHPWGRGFAYVTIVLKANTHFGHRIRVKTHWSDCDHVASLIRSAVEAAK